MRNRVAQLACLLLLLTSVSAADASTRRREFSLGSHYISVLMQNAAAVHIDSPILRQFDSDENAAASLTTSAPRPSAFAMRPPAAHSVHVHAVTGSGI
jgi:hypothetical protein